MENVQHNHYQRRSTMVIILTSTEPISCDECGGTARMYIAVNLPQYGCVTQLCADHIAGFIHSWEEHGLQDATDNLKGKRRVASS